MRPDYVDAAPGRAPAHPPLLSESELDRLRSACRVATEVLQTTLDAAAPGVTTDQLDAVAHEAYIERGAYPSTLGYKGYPKSICTSVNAVICHGIPDDRPLAEGDIVNVDVTAFVEGMHGDTSATVAVGAPDEATAALIDTTRLATLRGVAAVAPGRPLGVIGEAIEPYAAARGFGVIREYGGHGIGERFHGPPHVNHCVERGAGVTLAPGMCFTIEPMLTAGRPTFATATDGWTEHTDDSLISAQFEHTIVVTDGGVEVVTLDAAGRSPVGSLADLER